MILAQPMSFFFGLFSLGVLLERVDFLPPTAVFWVGVLAIVPSLLGRWRRPVAWGALGVLVVVAGWVRARHAAEETVELLWDCLGEEAFFQAEVIDLPIKSKRGGGYQCRLGLVGPRCGGPGGEPGEAFFLSRCSNDFHPGDRVQGRLLFEERSRLKNHWDLRLWETRRVVAKAPFGLVLLEPSRGWSRGLSTVKKRVIAKARERFSPEVAGVVLALGMGEKRLIPWETRERWSDTGVAHLLAISGLHVGIIAMCCYGALFWGMVRMGTLAERWNVRWAAVGLTSGLSVGFCVWAGAPVSALRATVMVVFSLWARLAGGSGTGWNGLSLAGVGILLATPEALFNPGFLLSFISTGAVLGVGGSKGEGSSLGTGAFIAAMKVSVVTSLATGPVLAFCFGRVSLLGPLGNLIAVPVATFLLTPGALLYVLLEAAGFSDLWLLERALGMLVLVLEGWLECLLLLPVGTVSVSTGGWAAFTLGTLALWGGLLVGGGRLKAALVLLGGGLVLVGVFGGGVVFGEPFVFEEGELGVVFPDVGQGDGAIIHLPDGGVVVVDAGGTWGGSAQDPGRRVMARYLREMGVGRIDLMVGTHSHPDHVGGLLYLAGAFEVGELWYNGDASTSLMKKIIAAVKEGGGDVHPVQTLPESVALGGVILTPLHPRLPGDELFYPELGQNDNSVVFHLRYRGQTALFTGDISTLVEEDLGIEWPAAGLLKVPHHGSETSSSFSFIEAVSPEVSVISCGEGNSFGLPDAEIVDRYQEPGTVLLRTDTMGAVVVRTRGERWSYSTLRGPEVPR